MRIAIGGLIHESSTCVDTQTTRRNFEQDRGIYRGQELLECYRGTNVCTGGFLEGAEQLGFEPVPLLRAAAFPGGVICRQDYEELKAEFLELLRVAEAADGPVDGALLDLHGAMVVDGIPDGDGDFVAAVREYLGPDRPIMITQDLHGNHTPLRVQSCNALIGFDTFPHVDMAERGREAAELIVRTIRGEIAPAMVLKQLPMFWTTTCQVTARPPMIEVMQRVHELEQRDGILSVTIATGFPWADVPDVGASIIVVADGDRGKAQAAADELAGWIWQQRQRWYSPPVTVRDALAQGKEVGKYPLILADHADNTGGGSPGDSTEVLQAFLDMKLEKALLLYLVDPAVAEQAHAAGVGKKISVSLGGKSHPAQGEPVQAEAEVKSLSQGRFSYDGPMYAGLQGNMGRSAWLQIDGVSVVVVSAREQPFCMAFARSLGIDVPAMKYIALKSAAHFRAAFEPIAGNIINVDAQAIHTHDFRRLKYTRRTRPVFPVEIQPPVA